MSTTNERIHEDVLLDVLKDHADFKDFKTATVTEIHQENKA